MTNTTTETRKLTVRQCIDAVKARFPRAMFIPGYGGGTWMRGVASGFESRVDWEAEEMFIDLCDANGYSV